MYTEEDINSAIAAGIFSHQTASAFRAHTAKAGGGSAVDEEHFRLVTGFNDIFVVIACLLLLASVAWIGAAVAPGLGAIAVAVAAWALAEFFTRKRGMALPSIVLLLAFIGGIVAAVVQLASSSNQAYVAAVAGALAGAAAWLHWLRFHVPITIAVGVAAAVGGTVLLLVSALPDSQRWTPAIMFIAGIGVFALALKWDATDTARQTRRSDVAFWLHLLSAPLLVHPVFASLGVFDGHTNLGQAVAVIGLYIAIALISLFIDRRAMMVSALIYVLFSFSTLLRQYGVVSLSFAITALVIGSALLLLSAFWHPSRKAILSLFPVAVQARLAVFR